jgi:oligo-1,6-glucosidase
LTSLAVVYQAYPASFKDSDDDGIGGIPGIISKLNYIRSLGVDVLWISPHYKSLQIDGGFDIVNHEEIHEAYGTLEQCQELIHETHKSGMKIIFDLVMNHTSHQHRWFLESRSSKQSPKRDWYIWRPAKYLDGVHCAPNNWRSQYSVPAWTWDETTEEYYFHMYAPEMPDLNWDNDECRQAIYQSTMIFWLDRGIDGFRIDTANKFAKDMNFPDVEVTLPDEVAQPATKYYSNMPRRREFLLEIREIIDRYQNIMTVGALPNTPLPQNVLPYVSAKARKVATT